MTENVNVGLKNDGYSSTRKTSVASFVGIFFENYNNIAAALVSAVVWPTVFFPSVAPDLGLLLGISTYVVGYVAGVIGAFLFGQYGDRSGRRNVGVLALGITAVGA